MKAAAQSQGLLLLAFSFSWISAECIFWRQIRDRVSFFVSAHVLAKQKTGRLGFVSAYDRRQQTENSLGTTGN